MKLELRAVLALEVARRARLGVGVPRCLALVAYVQLERPANLALLRALHALLVFGVGLARATASFVLQALPSAERMDRVRCAQRAPSPSQAPAFAHVALLVQEVRLVIAIASLVQEVLMRVMVLTALAWLALQAAGVFSDQPRARRM